MTSGTTRFIPRRLPRLAFACEVPGAWWGFHEVPIAASDAILVACGWGDDRELLEKRPALVALDARSGAERFRLEVPVLRPGSSEGQVAPPAVLPDGRILVAVYQWDAALTVHVLDPDGRIAREDELGEDGRMVALDLYGADSGVKLFLGRPVAAGGAYLVSWVYRSRSNHLMCRDLATGEPLWERDEWLLACAGGLAIGETDPPGHVRRAGAEVVARELARGQEVWRLGPEHALEPDPPGAVVQDRRPVMRSAAGTVGDQVLFIDRAARREALLRRDSDVLDRAVDSGAEQPDFDELERGWDAEHGEALAEELVAHDLAGGDERWRVRTGEVISIECAPHACCLVALDRSGAAELVQIDPRGHIQSRSRLPLDPGDQRPARRAPRVIAIDDELLLWSSSTELVCVELARPGVELWRLPLPAPCECDPPRPRDRLLRGASIAVADGRLYLRDGRRVWGFE
ncbi:MAG TPA: PQQ-binding-like beta-propeller repeat protein [Kofleriaceae bacterium]|nr:PQQ-binding-like beta-propeller repeat protein [Kofleriaceae bacterium]